MRQQKPETSDREAAPQTESNLRGADFKIGLILFTVASLLFYFTRTTFPMSGSYGGVENQWYVSPALFPLAVLSVLIFCSVVLLFHAVKGGGHKQFLNLESWIGDFKNSINFDRWYIISLLVLYVYVFIPSVDFYLATVLFLMSLTLRFYIGYKKLFLILFAHFLLTVALFLLRYKFAPEFYFFSTQVGSDEKLILYSDLATLAALLTIASSFVFQRRARPKKIAYMLCTSLLVPLILIIVFNYFLYVPMPVEQGSVINLLNILAYDIIGLQ